MLLDSLFVEFGAKAAMLNSAFDRIEGRVFGLETALNGFGNAALGAGAAMTAAGAAIAAPLGLAVKEFVTAGSALNDMSVRTGIAAESLSVLQYAAELSGGSIQDVETGLRKMSRTVVDAAQGQEEAVKALGLLGLKVEELEQLSPEAQFTAIADKLSLIENPTLKSAAAMEVFGRSGTMLLPMLEDGAAGLQQFAAEAQRLGVVMSSQDAKAADELGDRFDQLHMQFNAMQRTIGSALAPTLIQVAERFQMLLSTTQQFVNNNRELVVMAAQAASALVGLGGGLTGVGLAAKLAAPALSVLGSAAAALLSPFGLIAAGVGLAAGALLYLSGDPIKTLVAGFLAAQDVVVATADIFVAAFTPIADFFYATVVAPIGEYLASLGITFSGIGDVIVTALAWVSFAATNWRDVLAVQILNVQYGVVRFAEDVKYWFTEALPQYLNWLGENWINIFADIGKGTAAILINVGKNIYDFFAAVQNWLSGGTFDFTPTALLDGFTAFTQALPEIAARGESELEASLREAAAGATENLARDFAEFRQQFAGEVDAGAAQIPRSFEELMEKLGLGGAAMDLKVKPTLDTGTGFDLAEMSTPQTQQKQDFRALRTAFVDIQALGIGRETDPALQKMDQQIQIAQTSRETLEQIRDKIGSVS